jgi:hypothetical protein
MRSDEVANSGQPLDHSEPLSCPAKLTLVQCQEMDVLSWANSLIRRTEAYSMKPPDRNPRRFLSYPRFGT